MQSAPRELEALLYIEIHSALMELSIIPYIEMHSALRELPTIHYIEIQCPQGTNYKQGFTLKYTWCPQGTTNN